MSNIFLDKNLTNILKSTDTFTDQNNQNVYNIYIIKKYVKKANKSKKNKQGKKKKKYKRNKKKIYPNIDKLLYTNTTDSSCSLNASSTIDSNDSTSNHSHKKKKRFKSFWKKGLVYITTILAGVFAF